MPDVVAGEVFADIHGQDAAVERLRRALETGRVAHAYAFVGPAGSGRRATALAFARALVAPAGGAAADRVARGAHPDVHLVQPTPPEGNPKGPLALRIDSVREIERLAGLRPAMAPFKVFIVDDADRMTAATPQAFLKTLEEPPARTVIILILSRLRALPATVLSRCQIVRFGPRPAPGTVALLPDGRSAEAEAALSWLGEVAAAGPSAIPAHSDALARERSAAERAIETWWLWYRDRLCSLGGAGDEVAVFGDRQAVLSERARALSLDQVVDGLRACREAWQAIQGNVSPRLTVEVLLTRLVPRVA
jgi:DNA polymerase-3 subunit delta'